MFEHGSDVEDAFVLPGDVVTGGVVKPNETIVWMRVKTSSISEVSFRKATQLSTGHFILAGDPTNSQLLLNRPFAGGGGTFKAFKTSQAVPSAKMRNGRKIEDRIMNRLRSGCLEIIDTTAFNVFLLGCTHTLLPVAYPDQAAYITAAVSAAAAPELDELSARHQRPHRRSKCDCRRNRTSKTWSCGRSKRARSCTRG